MNEEPEIRCSSSKTRLYEDGRLKIPGSSSKTRLYEDRWPKIPGVVLGKKVPQIQTTVGLAGNIGRIRGTAI